MRQLKLSLLTTIFNNGIDKQSTKLYPHCEVEIKNCGICMLLLLLKSVSSVVKLVVGAAISV